MSLKGRHAHQRGIVVFDALIAMVLLSLAAVALMRSVHTNTLVVGNLAFRQAAVSLSTAAVEKAVYDLFPPTRTIADTTNHDLARNYYSFRQDGEDRNGVPAALHGKREATVIYNNLPRILATGPGGASVGAEHPDHDLVELALRIDRTMRERAPVGWKGDQARPCGTASAARCGVPTR